MEMIGQAPGHVLDLLESHPKVLLTGAGVASFIAAKEQILGGYDIATDENGNVIEVYKPGFIQRMWEFSSDKFKTPLSGLIGVLVLIILLWGCIKLWAIFRIERSKVHMKESELIHTKGK
jgi:hypothetical protein